MGAGLIEPAGGMVDLHCHVLPGVDDGASDDAEALRMLQIAQEDGTGIVAATPHEHRCPAERIAPGVARLNQLAAEAGLTIRVVPGSEVRIANGLLARYREGRLVTLNGTRHILLEMPLSGQGWLPLLHRCIADLQGAGLWPILAHAERYEDVQHDPECLRAVIAAGVPVQVNASSLIGPGEWRAKPVAERLVRERLAHLLASDGHGLNWQPPRLRAAATRLADLAGADYASWMLANAVRVLHGEALDLPEPASAD